MFNTTKKRLNKLVNSDRYKNSNYTIQKVNGEFGLKHNTTGRYVDLLYNFYKWEYGSRFSKDCFGSRRDVLRAFNYLYPIVEPLNIESEY